MAPYPCDSPAPIEKEPHHHLAIANEFVRAFAVEIAPHDHTLCHRHEHEYLMYVACLADIVSAPREEEPETHLYKDEECELAPPGMVHVVENLTDTKFRNILLEFLPRAADLRRGRAPDVVEGGIGRRVRQRFDSRMASVYVLSMRPNSEVQISGPAVVASPYGHEVELLEPGERATKLNKFEDLAWLRPFENGIVRSHAKTSARVVVFQLGASDEEPLSVRKTIGEPLKSLRTHAEDPE